MIPNTIALDKSSNSRHNETTSMLLSVLLSSALLATTRIHTSVSAQGNSYAQISVNQQINATTTQTTRGTVRQEIHDQKVENRCTIVTDRVNNHARMAEVVKDNRARIYQGVTKRLEALFTKLEAKGCNVSTAKSNLSQFQTMISSYRNHFNGFIDALHALQNKVCQENAQDYKAAHQAVLDQRKAAVAELRSIHDFYKNTLRPSVRDLRTSCKAATSSPEAEGAQ